MRLTVSWLFLLLGPSKAYGQTSYNGSASNSSIKDAFIDNLVNQMTVPELVMQVYLLFADSVVGPYSNNSLYNSTLHLAPDAGIGVIHDWYPLNKTYVNELQRLNIESSRLGIPFMHVGECLHGVGSFQQSMFPQSIAMAASWDADMVHTVGSAIGAEARSIGVHACLSPVLDVCQDQRWGRCQEDWGEDHIFTSHMGVAYASGLSKNSSWSQQDAVVPVMKHFAAHGAPQGGLNTAPFMGHGNRQVLQDLLMPFKAAVDLGGVKGVMMAYSSWDGIPSGVHPALYDALDEWGYSGFVIADDTGMKQLQTLDMVTSGPADTIAQWLNAGGMIDYYDYPLDTYLTTIEAIVANGTVALSTLQDRVRRVLGVKYDLGLFSNPYINNDIDAEALVDQHIPTAYEAAQKSIVLIENKNSSLPLQAAVGTVKKLALIGPFSDSLNYGDYSGQFGAYPVAHSSTTRQGILSTLSECNSTVDLLSSWGANSWLYNGQHPIPGYHLSTLNSTSGGLSATYYADTNFTTPLVHTTEVPVGDWGLYPPPGLPSNNFSATWEGYLDASVDTEVEGWLGIAIGANTTAKVFIDDSLLVDVPLTTTGNILSNIPSYAFIEANSTAPPPGSSNFTFAPNSTYKIRIEYQTYNLYQKIENQGSLNSQVLLFWNLVDRRPGQAVQNAVEIASQSDVIVLSLGAAWNSDGENGDRGIMDLSTNQTALAQAIFDLKKPTILLLSGGRPFAIDDFYNASSAVLLTYFGGQASGQAISDVLFGDFNPGGRLPLTVPRHEGQMPVYYNYKATAHAASYVDMLSSPAYPFGYGLSYTNFSVSNFGVAVQPANGSGISNSTFGSGSTLVFTLTLKNTGAVRGSYVPQVYLLQRISQITQPVKQLVAFTRTYLDPGQTAVVRMEVDVDRYLRILNRRYKWELEKGSYTFALLENGGMLAETGTNVTLSCAG
ncbi:hypothetical protein LTR78_002907 [Recurvomyces mirabilis]|uniref:xylan 1,4-beta-xylosidase n=1 Tax=Recurvomyces mirabilis TaxID=574656 RepID=A0AAE0WTM1_9PEZI|nr:hypothetical protein LTR78_002907 [Recurvomyces mirabilis]KAK5159359.1 hypothetical protein LTS14_002501 [Recurvomyces mirabilis]